MRKRLAMIILLAPLLSQAQEQSHIDAARELLETAKADQIIEQTYEQVMPFFRNMTNSEETDAGRREILDRGFAKLMDAMREEMNWENMEPLMIDIYVDIYSEEELRALNDFYASPIGQKFIEKTPQLTAASMNIAAQMLDNLKPRMEEVQEELREELKAYRVKQQVEQASVE